MISKSTAAVYLTGVACLSFFVGWLIPFWFGRRYKYSTKKQWGLFYTIDCELGSCINIGGAIRTETVDFLGGSGTCE